MNIKILIKTLTFQLRPFTPVSGRFRQSEVRGLRRHRVGVDWRHIFPQAKVSPTADPGSPRQAGQCPTGQLPDLGHRRAKTARGFFEKQGADCESDR